MADAVPRRPLPPAGEPAYAHTPNGDGKWHTYAAHARGVGALASQFAEPFGGGSIALFLGYTHDAGKLVEEVQQALRLRAVDNGGRLGSPHKAEGAALASLILKYGGSETAAIIAALANFGHHRGIPDASGSAPGAPIPALEFMQRNPHHLDELVESLSLEIGVPLADVAAQVSTPEWLSPSADDAWFPYRRELFTRMCHSALVDADFLDTHAHFRALGTPRIGQVIGMARLRETFMSAYESRYPATDSELGRLRRGLFERSVASGLSPGPSGLPAGGMYRLPAQTGSGKTMAAAGFALHHAERFDKRRVIVAVPFTSITTQNAQAYREMFKGLNAQVVLEHHSNILDDQVADDSWRRFSAANWDAEFVVTTTVQLFDSLFSNRPSATRKLHRLVNSVLILDEIQALPTELVPALLRMLRELSEDYGVTVLLASATQPDFWSLPVWDGFDAVDIVPLDEVPAATRRVTYQVRREEQAWEEVADEIAAESRVLVIVNTTKEAQHLHGLVADQLGGSEHVFHLSTRLCGAHRAAVLDEVRRRLVQEQPAILISTQLIEAGVDVDFPVVFRALAPAEAVIQSAGRCNREGRLGLGAGRVVVFQPLDGKMPGGVYQQAFQQTRALFVDGDEPLSFDDPSHLNDYFRRVFQRADHEKSDKINTLRRSLQFEELEEVFQMIDFVLHVLQYVAGAV